MYSESIGFSRNNSVQLNINKFSKNSKNSKNSENSKNSKNSNKSYSIEKINSARKKSNSMETAIKTIKESILNGNKNKGKLIENPAHMIAKKMSSYREKEKIEDLFCINLSKSRIKLRMESAFFNLQKSYFQKYTSK